MKSFRLIFTLLSSLAFASQALAEREFQFMVPDLEPFVINDRARGEPGKGIHVELLRILATKLNRKFSFVALPTRRVMSGAYKAQYDGTIYADFVIDQVPVLRDNYDRIGPLFAAHLLLFQKRASGQISVAGKDSIPPPGIVGAIGTSCNDALKDFQYLQKFDIKDPEQGVMMLFKGRINYLCLSDVVVYHLLRKLSIKDEEIDILRTLTSYNFLLLLHKKLPAEEKLLFGNAIKTAAKEGWFNEVHAAYNIKAATR